MTNLVFLFRLDILKSIVLMTYGGIYLDNDVYVVNSLDKYRKYEMTLGWEATEKSIRKHVLIANRQARFLKASFDQYRYLETPFILTETKPR